MQTTLHIVGLVGMVFCFIALLFFLVPENRSATDSQVGSYAYLIGAPMGFLIFLMVFMLPVFWQGRSSFSTLVLNVLGYDLWNHLDRIGFMFYMLAPMVIGFTTFSMQSSIYYDADTLVVYLLGDLLIIYILALVAVAAIENQMVGLNAWLQHKVFGSNNKYSVLVVED